MLVVFLSDGLLQLKESREGGRKGRFFKIALALPMDLQMVLCNRMFQSQKDFVLTKHSEPAFKNLVRSFVAPGREFC